MATERKLFLVLIRSVVGNFFQFESAFWNIPCTQKVTETSHMIVLQYIVGCSGHDSQLPRFLRSLKIGCLATVPVWLASRPGRQAPAMQHRRNVMHYGQLSLNTLFTLHREARLSLIQSI